jgi:hypothetical protein
MQVSSSELLRWTNWDDQLWRRIKGAILKRRKICCNKQTAGGSGIIMGRKVFNAFTDGVKL